jgi:uncharacterized zinc-type alcohol dehydrogenase-like protein
MAIERREPAANDVDIKVLFCGVCHSDVHQVKNEWKNTVYPCMPGHEIVGRVTRVGAEVTRFAIGDIVGVGCMVDSCHHCSACNEGLENYCENGFLATYNGNMQNPSKDNLTYGGYSDSIVVREDFVLSIPEELKPEQAAPILCAGVTTYSPMRHWNVGPGTKVGIVAYGGLGQIAAKIAKALGSEVTVITRAPKKKEDAVARGANQAILSINEDEMSGCAGKLDFILSTIPQPHDANPFMALLKRDGIYAVVGCIAPLSEPLDLSKMLPNRKSLATSLIGSIRETQEVLEFCAEHRIVPEIRVISVDGLNDAFEKVDKGEVDFRYVIDMATLRDKQPDHGLAAAVGL